jgi:pilus assembly protein Flp/PilA
LQNDSPRFDTQNEAKQGCISNELRAFSEMALSCNPSDRTGDIHVLSIFRKLMKNDDGATAIEYVLIASLISVAAIISMGKVGGKVSNVLSNVANAMT